MRVKFKYIYSDSEVPPVEATKASNLLSLPIPSYRIRLSVCQQPESF